jgi:hypothetical protein
VKSILLKKKKTILILISFYFKEQKKIFTTDGESIPTHKETLIPSGEKKGFSLTSEEIFGILLK